MATPTRVLIVNSYGYPANLLADSSFTLTKSIIKSLPKDRFHFIWVLPQLGLPIPHKYNATDALDLPDNVSVLQVPMLRFCSISEMLLSEELFLRINPVSGRRCDYDLVMTNNPNVAGRLADWFASVMYKNVNDYVPTDPPIVLIDYFIPFYGNSCECGYAKYYNNKLKSMYLGYATADKSFFFTQYCYNRVQEQYRKFYSAAETREFEGNRAKIFRGLFNRDNLPEPLEKRKTFSIYWGGRLTAGKRVKFIVEMANRLYETGRQIKMVLTLPDEKSLETLKYFIPENYGDIFEVHCGLSQYRAFEVMTSCHASVFAQSMRYGPAAPMEQLCSGLVVLPFKRQSDDVLSYDYPYYWTNQEELLAHLFEVYDKYGLALDKVKPYCKLVANSCSLEGKAEALASELEELVSDQDERIRNKIVPTMSLLRGRIEEVQKMSRRSPISFQTYVDWLLNNHRVYSVLRHEMNPFYLNPALWILYKTLRTHVPSKLLRDDPVFYSDKTKHRGV